MLKAIFANLYLSLVDVSMMRLQREESVTLPYLKIRIEP